MVMPVNSVQIRTQTSSSMSVQRESDSTGVPISTNVHLIWANVTMVFVRTLMEVTCVFVTKDSNRTPTRNASMLTSVLKLTTPVVTEVKPVPILLDHSNVPAKRDMNLEHLLQLVLTLTNVRL